MKLVREHINEKFTEESDPIRDMGIGKVPYHYNNLYIAKHDIKYVSDHHKVLVPKGTVMSAAGGGMFGDSTGNISLGNISKVNGKDNWDGFYDIRKDKDNYIEVYNDVWEKSIALATKIDNWFRDGKNIDAAAKVLDIDKVYEIIEHQRDVIKKIEKLLK
jgi:hypothetical protein